MKKQYQKISILSLLAVFVLVSGFSCRCMSKEEKQALQPIVLNYWRAWDDTSDFQEIINAYQTLHPNITINYRKLRYQEYENELLNAWAEDRGPDIFSIRNTWVRDYQNKILPLPPEITMAYQFTQKALGIKQETIIEVRKEKSLTPTDLANNFLDVVNRDAVVDGKIWGLPLSVDTLVMYYNRDLLNNAGIALPPTEWRQFQSDIKKITLLNRDNTIIQAGAALGTGRNVLHASDIISLLMMQNGAQMVDPSGRVTFQNIPESQKGSNYNPGIEAVKFYTDFALPSREVYSWNSTMPDSRKAFAQGLVGFYFGYSSDMEYIEANSKGKIHYNLTKIPQIEGNPEINFANYWLEVVSKKSGHLNEAWDFIQFATQAQQAKKYLVATKQPTALRSLVDEQKNSEDMNVFGSQLLTTRTWYRGKNAKSADNILIEMIDSILQGADPVKAVPLAAEKVQQTIR
ncbi:extracellular solute-binding protein [Patescibacteria group bacterium]|nr:extracellular solute-binding protein [Patescibacteria group bacterium]